MPAAVRDEASKVYLRPETAQGIFANYRNVLDSTRLKLPSASPKSARRLRGQ